MEKTYDESRRKIAAELRQAVQRGDLDAVQAALDELDATEPPDVPMDIIFSMN